MTIGELTILAEATVCASRRKLPKALQSLAEALPVVYHDRPGDEILGDEFDPEILGMFVGSPFGLDSADSGDVPPHILLFLENIWDLADADRDEFIHEVKLTYLHELGHYLGWDEAEVAAHGLE
ncbi:MAG: metallopeptidase family protein [Opitutaceae bacterium]|nr:metallopeptidase family protein [Opitutaceae bacterium]